MIVKPVALDYTLRVLKGQSESAKAVLAKFRADLEENPDYTLEWGDSAFRAAANLRVAEDTLAALESMKETMAEEQALEALISLMAKEVLYEAMLTSQSSSQATNLMVDHRRKAKASLLAKIS